MFVKVGVVDRYTEWKVFIISKKTTLHPLARARSHPNELWICERVQKPKPTMKTKERGNWASERRKKLWRYFAGDSQHKSRIEVPSREKRKWNWGAHKNGIHQVQKHWLSFCQFYLLNDSGGCAFLCGLFSNWFYLSWPSFSLYMCISLARVKRPLLVFTYITTVHIHHIYGYKQNVGTRTRQ